MRWFRANRKFGGRLALFALAVQLALSFGHIHREDIYGPARPHTATSLSAQSGSQQSPTDPSSKHTDDYCAICATISLLSNSFVAAAPQLALPLASYAVEHTDSVATVFIARQRTAFQSRAPPVA
jgi:hypothetical protein